MYANIGSFGEKRRLEIRLYMSCTSLGLPRTELNMRPKSLSLQRLSVVPGQGPVGSRSSFPRTVHGTYRRAPYRRAPQQQIRSRQDTSKSAFSMRYRNVRVIGIACKATNSHLSPLSSPTFTKVGGTVLHYLGARHLSPPHCG